MILFMVLSWAMWTGHYWVAAALFVHWVRS